MHQVFQYSSGGLSGEALYLKQLSNHTCVREVRNPGYTARWVVAVRDEKRDGLKAKAPFGNFCLKAGVLNILGARNPKAW